MKDKYRTLSLRCGIYNPPQKVQNSSRVTDTDNSPVLAKGGGGGVEEVRSGSFDEHIADYDIEDA